ncbi:hypothetical protein X777_12235 [Ooceraea biroi]|uniref:Uncharacterized protein n=1 Tax=Ooceraea biroi TaxID=2015173 RepID=A0A026W3B9_OOCBI|nr:hypothetical protein X777_12235 [Ooceraea biroi]
MAQERPEFAGMQRVSMVQFLCDRERGIRGANERFVGQRVFKRYPRSEGLLYIVGPAGVRRWFELLVKDEPYSICNSRFCRYSRRYTDVDFSDDLWDFKKYNIPWMHLDFQLIHHDLLCIVRKCRKCGEKMCKCSEI